MILYIEYVIIENFCIDYFLINLTHYFLGIKASVKRVVLSCFLGAVFALILPLVSLSKTLNFLVKALIGLVLSLSATNTKNVKTIIKFYFALMLFTFLMGGITYAFFSTFSINKQNQLMLTLITFPLGVLYKILKKAVVIRKRAVQELSAVYNVKITLNEKTLSGIGFFDTGNLTYIENSPVVFINYGFIKNVIDVGVIKNAKKIDVYSLGGKNSTYCIKLTTLSVFYNNQIHIYNNVWAGIINRNLPQNANVLLHGELIKGGNYESVAK